MKNICYEVFKNTEDIFVTMVDLPCTIKSYVIPHPDQTYTVVLNSRLTREQNMLSYMHELFHIRNGDLEKRCSVDLVEIVAHKNRI